MRAIPDVDFERLGGGQAARFLDELGAVYAEVYAEPPYRWGRQHESLFRRRLAAQCRLPGFSLVTARVSGELVGFVFGVPLDPASGWWTHLTAVSPAVDTRERPGRTFAVVELAVRLPWRRRGIARTLHDLLLQDRPEERATLSVLPDACAAQAAYAAWGWRKVGRKRDPWPGAPVFDVLVKPLRPAG